MFRGNRGKFVLVAILIAVLSLTSYLLYVLNYNYLRYIWLEKGFSYADAIQNYQLIESSSSSDETAGEENLVENPPIFVEERTAIVGFSTGEFYNISLNSVISGDYLADAVVMRVVSKNRLGLPELFDVVLQIVDPENSQKPITPAFVGYANSLKEEDQRIYLTRLFSMEEIKDLFPWGSKWIFIPFGASDFALDEYQKYSYLASKYYGNDYAEIENYTSSGLTKDTSRPILLFDLQDFNFAATNLEPIK